MFYDEDDICDQPETFDLNKLDKNSKSGINTPDIEILEDTKFKLDIENKIRKHARLEQSHTVMKKHINPYDDSK